MTDDERLIQSGGSVAKRLPDVFPLQVRISVENLIFRHPFT
jgi:hypothetical protein